MKGYRNVNILEVNRGLRTTFNIKECDVFVYELIQEVLKSYLQLPGKHLIHIEIDNSED